MGVSVFTFLMSLLWCNLFIFLSVLCQRALALKYGVNLILAMISIGILRLLIPIEVPSAIVVRSEAVMPFFQRFFTTQLFSLWGISINRLNVFLTVWVVGSVAYLFLIAWTIFEQGSKIKNLQTEYCPQVSNLTKEFEKRFMAGPTCRVIVSPEVKTPMLVGYVSPVILLPPLSLTDEDLRYVLIHEWNHFVHKHLWIKLVFNIFCAVLWWNPFVYMAKSDLDYILEVSCDRYVVRDLSSTERMQYVEATTTVMKQLASLVTRQSIPSVGFITAIPEKIVQRCELILFPPKKTSKWTKTFAATFLLFLAMSSYAFVFQTAYTPPEDNIPRENSVNIIPEHSYLQEIPDGGFILVVNGAPLDRLNSEDVIDPPYSELPIYK